MLTLHSVTKAHFFALLTAFTLIFAVPDAFATNRVVLGNASATTLAASTDAHVVQTLKALRGKAAKDEKIRIIVGVRAAFAAEGELNAADVVQQRNEIAAAQFAVQGKIPSLKATKEKIKAYSTIPFMALEVDAAELEALAGQVDITSIEEDRVVYATLAESVPLIGGSAAWSRGYTGAGQTVAILDTGVDKSHSFLTGKVVAEACYSTNSVPAGATSLCPGGVTKSTATGSGVNCDPALAGCFHGTHVAGIAAGAGASFSGVARNASIIAMQIFSRFTSTATCGSSTPCIATYTSDYNLALERVYALRSTYSIAAVNMSIGGGGYSSQALCDANYSATKTAIDNLRSVNIATIIASGNESLTNQISAPGCISTAISVGATSKADVVASYSNSASFLKLLAPGSAINSSMPGGGYAAWNGTSMATPHVAGAWALLKQQNASRSVTDTLSLLTATGVPITDAKSGVTTPRVRLAVALNAVPTLAYSSESGYGSVGVSPASGTASTLLTYKVIYTDTANTPPTLVRACIDGICNTMSVDASAAATLRDSNYTNGEQYVYSASLAAGAHTYYFTATDGTTTVNLPASGSLAGPTISGLTITTSTLPNGAFGTAYSQALAAAGGVSPYSWSSTTLPAGLSLDVNAGVISGTPTTVGLTGFSATVADAASAAFSKALSINVGKATPIITWANPAAITYPTALSGLQLNATANVAGGFVYTPASGTVLNAGMQSLSAAFTPTDTTNYNNATGSVLITVNKGTPAIACFSTPITYPTPLGSGNLSCTADVPGAFSYSPALGTVLNAGTQTITVIFTPTSTANYNTVSATATLVVNKGTPLITWANPAAITYGTLLSETQLNATANVPGGFVYNPAAGVLLSAGTQSLLAAFTPTDTANYNNATATATLLVNKADQTIGAINFSPSTLAINGSTTASATASSGLAVTFSSLTSSTICTVTSAGVVTGGTTAGNCTVVANQAGDANYNLASAVEQVIAVYDPTKKIPIIAWPAPVAIAYGTPLDGVQLNATATDPVTLAIVAGSLVYNPAAGAVLNAGSQALSVTFNPADTAVYNGASGSTTLQVNKSDQSIGVITFTPATLVAGGTTTASATASSGLPVTAFMSMTPTICMVSGNVVAGVAKGICAMGADQEGDSNYNPAPHRVQDIAVTSNVDLIMQTVSKTATAVGIGHNFVITNIARNQGTTPAAPTTVTFYLSLDDIITTADIKLTGTRAVPTLSAMTSSTSAATAATVPNTIPPGIYYVGACADAANVQPEETLAGVSLEDNNCKVVGIITVTRLVNLQMSAVSKTATVVGVGKTFTVTNTEKNVGTTHMTAASNTVKLYLSTDATITPLDIAIGSRVVSRLLAGQSSPSLATTVTVPTTVAPRVYYVGACADVPSVQIETIETDNCRAALGTINVVRNVDLVMSAVSTTATTIKAGGSLVISNTEKNQGTAAMLVGTTNRVNFYLSTDATITSADILLTGNRIVGALAAGASSSALTTVTVPAAVLPRVYYIGAIADGVNQLLESVENNNARAGGTITIN